MSAPYRAEVIGSLLRPAYLKEARASVEKKEIPVPEFERIEDRAVAEAIALQEAAGLDVVTDGEMRRFMFTSSLTDVIHGMSNVTASTMHWKGERPEEDFDFAVPICVTEKIRRGRSLATEEFAYAPSGQSYSLCATLDDRALCFNSAVESARDWAAREIPDLDRRIGG